MMSNLDKRKQSQGFVDMRKMTEIELKELLDRQLALLQNKSFIRKLPDKGQKIEAFKLQIEEELKKRDDVNATSNLLGNMNLNGHLEDVEWTAGKKSANKTENTNQDVDSDDDVDPIKLLATHCGTQKTKIRKERLPEQSLVTEKDIEEVRTFAKVPYADEFCKKIDRLKEPRERFKPCQPKSKEGLKSAFRSSSENVQKMMGKHWEVTAATPPVPLYGDTKMISLTDSLLLQKEQAEKLKDIQFKAAIAKLQQTTGMRMGPLPTTGLMKYRNPVNPALVFEGTPVRDKHEEEPVLDEEDEGGMSAVFYNIVDAEAS